MFIALRPNRKPQKIELGRGTPRSPIAEVSREIKRAWAALAHYPVVSLLLEHAELPPEEVALYVESSEEKEGYKALSFRKNAPLKLYLSDDLKKLERIEIIPEESQSALPLEHSYVRLELLEQFAALGESLARTPGIPGRIQSAVSWHHDYDVDIHEIKTQFANEIGQRILEALEYMFPYRCGVYLLREGGVLVAIGKESVLESLEVLQPLVKKNQPGIFAFKQGELQVHAAVLYHGKESFGVITAIWDDSLPLSHLQMLRSCAHLASGYLSPAYT